MNDLELDMFHKYFSSNYWSFFYHRRIRITDVFSELQSALSSHYKTWLWRNGQKWPDGDLGKMIFDITRFSSVWKVWSGNKFLFLIRNESEALESKEQKLPSCIITADSTFELKIKYLDFLLWLSKKMIIQKNGQYGDRTRDIRVISTTL